MGDLKAVLGILAGMGGVSDMIMRNLIVPSVLSPVICIYSSMIGLTGEEDGEGRSRYFGMTIAFVNKCKTSSNILAMLCYASME